MASCWVRLVFTGDPGLVGVVVAPTEPAPPPIVEPAPEPGNAACVRCGGPAYHGLHVAECLRPGGCPGAPALEPAEVYPTLTERLEWVWTAEGLGRVELHPLRAEAIAAWRRAVTG